jgi:hypothetical protein
VVTRQGLQPRLPELRVTDVHSISDTALESIDFVLAVQICEDDPDRSFLRVLNGDNHTRHGSAHVIVNDASVRSGCLSCRAGRESEHHGRGCD